MKQLKEILKLIKVYCDKHGYHNGATLEIETDESGELKNYPSENNIFYFHNIDELFEKLKE
jgi:hypothetical protein